MSPEKALSSWVDLNNYIMDATEDQAAKLLELEKAGENRRQYLLRIHSRVNKLRAHREREALKKTPKRK